MNSGVLDLKIKTDDTLIDFEKHTSRMQGNISEVHMHLSKIIKRNFLMIHGFRL